MRCTGLILTAFFSLASLQAYSADISPSRKVVPDQFRDPPGKRYSLFAGDPKRVQKANEVKVEDFTASLELSANQISISASADAAPLQAVFTIRNKSDRDYTLSFPDAQRYDLAIVTQDDRLLYLWSEDKAFVQQTGMSFLNAGEILQFTQQIQPEIIKEHCSPGRYKIAMVLSNYPELKSGAVLEVTP